MKYLRPEEVKTFTNITLSNTHKASANGFEFTVANDRGIGEQLRKKGFYEPFETTLFMAYVRYGDVVVDVGANVGYYTLAAARQVGKVGTVISVEPDPYNLTLLGENAKRWKNVEVYPFAASNKTENAFLYPSQLDCGDHRLWECDGRIGFSVKAVTIDDILGGRPVNLLKIDTQGYEDKVLEGAQRSIDAQKHMALSMELWPYGLKRAGGSHKAICDFLCNNRFGVAVINDMTGRLVYMDPDLKKLRKLDADKDEVINLWCVK